MWGFFFFIYLCVFLEFFIRKRKKKGYEGKIGVFSSIYREFIFNWGLSIRRFFDGIDVGVESRRVFGRGWV